MAKQTGMGTFLWVDGVDLSGDVGAVNQLGTERNVLDVTGLDKTALERVYGVTDSDVEFIAWFNDAAGQAHPTLSSLPTTDRLIAWVNGSSAGAAALSLEGKQINYDGTRGIDGGLTLTVAAQGSTGVPAKWGRALTTGIDDFTGAANTASYDVGEARAGGALIVHCTEFTGTSLTVTLEESTDDGAGDAFASVDGTAVITVTAAGAQRVDLASSITTERYLRAAVAGTFTTASLGIIAVHGPATA